MRAWRRRRGGQGLGRVDSQGVKDRVDRVLSHHTPAKRLIDIQLRQRCGAVQGKRSSLPNDRSDISRLENGATPSGESKQLLCNAPGLADGHIYLPQSLNDLRVLAGDACCAHVQRDAREKVVEIVGQPAGEDSEGLEFLAAYLLFLELSLLSDIGNRPDNPQHLAPWRLLRP